jgi:hypothetical protein
MFSSSCTAIVDAHLVVRQAVVPDPFPGSGFVSHKYGSGSVSFPSHSSVERTEKMAAK